MNIADLILKLVNFLLQKLVYPVLPNEISVLSFSSFSTSLLGLEHNLNYAFASLDTFFNLQLLFSVIILIASAEIIFWVVRAGKWVIEMVRG